MKNIAKKLLAVWLGNKTLILGAIALGLIVGVGKWIYESGRKEERTQNIIEQHEANHAAQKRKEAVPMPDTDGTIDRLRAGTF